MSSEDLVMCIEEAFAGLEHPSLEGLAAPDTYVDESFIEGVGSKTWQELRPLRDYVGDGSEIVLLSAKAYQYYLPAYLVALVDKRAEKFYLDWVLDSLCCDRRGVQVGDRGPTGTWRWLGKLAENRGFISVEYRSSKSAAKGPWDAKRGPRSSHEALVGERSGAAKARTSLNAHIKDLRRHLQAYFKITANPIVFAQSGYKAQFQIGRSPSYRD